MLTFRSFKSSQGERREQEVESVGGTVLKGMDRRRARKKVKNGREGRK